MVIPLKAHNISKAFGNEPVLRNLNLQLFEHETLSILGRSGCGKTTLLKILAGLETPDHGEVYLHDKNIDHMTPHKRDIVYLYQEALLFPHLTAFENIAFGLRLRKVTSEKITGRTNEMIDHLELGGMQDKMPHQLSGGQKQRVSFGRALITNSNVLLLDEPFGNLDADTRSSMQQLFKRIAEKLGITAIFVTHNIKEAILMGDRIARLDEGNLTTYSSVDTFISASESGVREEINFWKSLSNNAFSS